MSSNRANSQQKEASSKKKFKFPPLLVLILIMLLLASISTYLIPAGAFDQDEATGQLLAGTFHTIASSPVSPWNALSMIYEGMNNNADTINLVLFFGGIIGIFLSTGAVEDFLNWVIYRLKDRGIVAIVVLCTFMMSALGAFAASDALIAFVAVGVIICHKLRLDPLVSVGIFYYGCFVGFCTGPICAHVAQSIAGIPIYSGFLVRTVWWLFLTGVTVVYILWYCRRIRRDPTKSAMGNTLWLQDCVSETEEVVEVSFNLSSMLIVILMFGGFFFSAFALTTLGWHYGNVFASLSIVAVICAFLRKKTLEEIIDAFAGGLRDMAFIVFIIGAAATIGGVLKAGNVLPTIVYAVTLPLSAVSKGVSAIIMFIMNALINIMIPSRGAQAALVIPIMTPIADMLGITRQVAVTAFNLGDGLTNMINPLDGCTIGALALAGVSYDKWFKWCLPISLILMGLSCVFLYFLSMAGWVGF